jgi:hypothetical protein
MCTRQLCYNWPFTIIKKTITFFLPAKLTIKSKKFNNKVFVRREFGETRDNGKTYDSKGNSCDDFGLFAQ